jgi:archaellum component FlaF (FlaF/FlaG flagellin family)
MAALALAVCVGVGLAVAQLAAGVDSTSAGSDRYPFRLDSSLSGSFHSAVKHTTFDGVQTAQHVATFQVGQFGCTSIKYSGTQATSTSETLSLAPTYSGCSNPFIGAVTVHVNGCQFVFAEASGEILCPGAPMEITYGTPQCVITIASQTLSEVSVKTGSAPPTRDIGIALAISGIKYVLDSPGIPGCTGSYTNGTYRGEITVKGTNAAGEQTDLWFL